MGGLKRCRGRKKGGKVKESGSGRMGVEIGRVGGLRVNVLIHSPLPSHVPLPLETQRGEGKRGGRGRGAQE